MKFLILSAILLLISAVDEICTKQTKDLHQIQTCKLEQSNHRCTRVTDCIDNQKNNDTHCTLKKNCITEGPQTKFECVATGYSEMSKNDTVHADVTETCRATMIATGKSTAKECRVVSVNGKKNTTCQLKD